MSFSDPEIFKHRLSPYPESDFSVLNDLSFAIKTPWLELRGEVGDSYRLLIRRVEDEWRQEQSDVVSDFLMNFFRWPVCYLYESYNLDGKLVVSPQSAFSKLRRDYLNSRMNSWKNVAAGDLDAKRIFANHYQFLKGSDLILEMAAHHYGALHESVRIFREQEFGHWRLLESCAHKLSVEEDEPSEKIGQLLSIFTSATQESFFKFCMFVAICEGTLARGPGMAQENELADLIERKSDLSVATGIKIHSKINSILNHESAAYDFLSCAEYLTLTEYEDARCFIQRVSDLQNDVMYDLKSV